MRTTTDETLSAALRRGTADVHERAERSPYLTALVEGRVTGVGLAALLGRLAPVYEALERVARTWADNPAVQPFLVPGVERTERLRADLQYLTGSPDAALTSAAVAYAARIEDAGRASAAAFVGHHYTRVLGDLSGGIMLRGAVQRSLGLEDGAGASFFAFPGLKPGAVKQAYRAALDASDLDPEVVVAEASKSFRLSIALNAELDADLTRWSTS